MRKPSRTTKGETASPQTKAGLTLNDGAGCGGYDRYERV